MKLLFWFLLFGFSVPTQAEQDVFDFDLTEVSAESSGNSGLKTGHWNNSATLGFNQRHAVARPERFLSQSLRLDLEAEYKREGFMALIAAYGESDSSRDHYRDRLFSEVGTAYIAWQSEARYLSFGKQRIAWGVADGRSGGDVLNAVDFRNPLANARTASRRSSWMFYWQEELSSSSLEFAWLPMGKDHKLPEFGSVWETASLAALRSAGAEITFRDDADYGLRWMKYGAGLDIGVTLFHGREDTPLIHHYDAGIPQLETPKLNLINIGLAKGLSSSTLRAEISFAHNRALNLGSNIPILQGEDYWSVIGGWDRTFFTSLYLNLQFYWQSHGELNELHGTTFAVSDKLFDDALEVGFRGAVERGGGSSQKVTSLNAELYGEYDLDDHWQLSLKGTVFDDNAFEGRDFIEFSVSRSF